MTDTASQLNRIDPKLFKCADDNNKEHMALPAIGIDRFIDDFAIEFYKHNIDLLPNDGKHHNLLVNKDGMMRDFHIYCALEAKKAGIDWTKYSLGTWNNFEALAERLRRSFSFYANQHIPWNDWENYKPKFFTPVFV